MVAHPTLVGILRGREGIIYQHGEIAVPPEAVVTGAEVVLVPTESVAGPFVRAGYRPEQIEVSGLCIEPSLVDRAPTAFIERQSRFDSGEPLTGLFVSSGAEPLQHVMALIESVTSAIGGDGKAVILARANGRLHRGITSRLSRSSFKYVSCSDPQAAVEAGGDVIIAVHDSRRALNDLTAALFKRFDYLVGPAHERTHWALGLGLPMFPLVPSIGPFAPLNLRVLLKAGVAAPLDAASPPTDFGRKLSMKRQDGSLRAMSEAGWGRYDIDGFDRIARFLLGRFGG